MQGRIYKWISEKAYLQQITLYLCHSDEFDAQLLEKILKAGIEYGKLFGGTERAQKKQPNSIQAERMTSLERFSFRRLNTFRKKRISDG